MGYVNLENARNDNQRKIMDSIQEENECPFCPANLTKYHKKPILRKSPNWILTSNQWPYDHTAYHLLAIATYHAESLGGLKDGAGEELIELFKWAVDKYKISFGGLAMRFGDVTKNGASVKHIHCHLIAPEPSKNESDKIRFKIG